MHSILASVTSYYLGNTDHREKLTVPYAVDYWINGGFPAHKIALGMGTYGRGFKLADASQHSLASSTPKSQWQGKPAKGKYTREGRIAQF